MKYQILTRNRTLICLLLASVSILSSCTKNYSELNTDPTRLTTLTSGDIKGLFTNAEYMAMYSGRNSSEYQYTQGLFADQYAQYSATTATFDPTDRFNIIQDWIQEQWQATYTKSLPPIFAIIKETNTPETKALNAIARIWKVWIMHRATDYYGPVPYSQVGKDGTSIKYDAQKDIYLDLFKELKEATDDLKANIAQPSYGDKDVIFGGDNAKWLKFGNTLRLRLALRVSDVDPVLAKAQAEAAVTGGTMINLDDDAYLKVSGTNYNGYTRQSGWNEFRMSETMESVLVGWSDPRLSKFWAPAVNTGKYKGVRNGMNVAEIVAAPNDPDNTSAPATELLPEYNFITPSTVMYTAEAYFLRAEGALNGWAMGGTPQSLYEKGIEMSLRTWKISDDAEITAYINNTSLPSAPGGYFNTPRLTDIPVKYEAGGSLERRREQVLTQKWIALFPEGHEGWASIRRSGYPKLYPVIHSDNPDVDPKKGIRRIPFLNYDKDRNAAAVAAAEALLGGPDKASTKLWWDVRP